MTVAELRAGTAIMPTGKRQMTMADNLERRLLPLFAGRILPFDLAASRAYAEVLRNARIAESGIAMADACIAAIAAANGFSIATRDVSPFQASGITVIDPWTHLDASHP